MAAVRAVLRKRVDLLWRRLRVRAFLSVLPLWMLSRLAAPSVLGLSSRRTIISTHACTPAVIDLPFMLRPDDRSWDRERRPKFCPAFVRPREALVKAVVKAVVKTVVKESLMSC